MYSNFWIPLQILLCDIPKRTCFHHRKASSILYRKGQNDRNKVYIQPFKSTDRLFNMQRAKHLVIEAKHNPKETSRALPDIPYSDSRNNLNRTRNKNQYPALVKINQAASDIGIQKSSAIVRFFRPAARVRYFFPKSNCPGLFFFFFFCCSSVFSPAICRSRNIDCKVHVRVRALLFFFPLSPGRFCTEGSYDCREREITVIRRGVFGLRFD